MLFSCSLGGMCGALVTSLFDVVKTRSKSDMFRLKHAGVGALVGDSIVLPYGTLSRLHISSGCVLISFPSYVILIYALRVTNKSIRMGYHSERRVPTRSRANLGRIPSRSINFFTYGNGKQIIAKQLNKGQESSYVHLCAVAIAGIVTTGTATNPVWVVKTRLQLSASKGLAVASTTSTTSPGSYIGGSVSTIRQIARRGVFAGFIRALAQAILASRRARSTGCYMSASSV